MLADVLFFSKKSGRGRTPGTGTQLPPGRTQAAPTRSDWETASVGVTAPDKSQLKRVLHVTFYRDCNFFFFLKRDI